METPAEIALVHNASARRPFELERFRRQWTAPFAVYQPPTREACIELVSRIAEQFEMIVAAGGDGTVNSVVEGFMQTRRRPVLGIVPLGTGNDFARGLGIPLDWRQAVEVLDAGRVRAVDVMQCRSNGETRWVANMLTGGNTGRYLEVMTDELKERWGPLCYLRGVVNVVDHLMAFRTTLLCDDGPPESFDALNVFLANGRSSGGGLPVSPDADPTDGLLDVIIIEDGDAGELATLGAEYVLRDYRDHQLVHFRRVREASIEANPPLPLTADGDVIGQSPLQVTLSHHAMRVRVPHETVRPPP